MRDFNNSFLLGENNKQLKLNLNNSINSFKHQVYDTKVDTVGGTYPIVARNAAVNYKTFSMTGTISFNMDDNGLFFTRTQAFGKWLDNYNQYNEKNNISLNDYIYFQ